MTALVGYPLGTLYQITNVTQGVPGVVTVTSVAGPNSFALVAGMTITISGVIGMTELNFNRYLVGNVNSVDLKFDLYTIRGYPLDTRAFRSYVGGGTINIISYAPGANEPPGLMYNNQ